MALTDKLTAIANGFRESRGTTNKLSLDEMATLAAVPVGGGGGDELPEEAFVFEKACTYAFANDTWNWFIEGYGDKITTQNIGDCKYMFANSQKIEEIPFDINFANDSYYDTSYMFQSCKKLKSIGKLINIYPSNLQYFFNACENLRELPEFVNPNWDRIHNYNYAYAGANMFGACYSLREIPESLLNELYNPKSTGSSYHIYYNGFNSCYNLDEIRGMMPKTGTVTTNLFSSTFHYCSRIKDIIFAIQDDGTPYSCNWKSQVIDLTTSVGYYTNLSQAQNYINNYNSGIVYDDGLVTDDASYQERKNSKDWFSYADSSGNAPYSRYNHDSAVNTINSLPDTSAYLATQSNATNTIKFKGEAGSATDGGAINTLTEAEIAIATVKGWTVTFV